MEPIAKKSNSFNGVKIIIASPLFPPEIEDIAIYTKNLAEHLKEKHQVQILAYAGNFEKISGVEIFTVDKKEAIFFRIFNYFIKLKQLAEKADVIYVDNSVASALPAILVKILYSKVVVVNFFEDEALKRARHFSLTEKSWQQFLDSPEANFKINLIRKLQVWILKRATRIIVSSNSLAQALSKAYQIPMDKMVVNYRVSDDTLKLPFETEIKKQQIFVETKLFSWSGLEEIIKALAILKDKFFDSSLVVIGDGPAKSSLQKLAEEQGVKERVDFRGWVSKAERHHFLKNSQVVVYNAGAEDFPNFIADYVLLKKEIVSITTDYTQEIFSDGAIYIKENKAQDIAQELAKIFSSSELARQSNVEKFSWNRHVSNLEKILEEGIKK